MDDDLKKFLKAVKKGGGVALPLSEALSAIMDDDDDEDTTVIGRTSPELLKRYKGLHKVADQLDDEMQMQTKLLAFEAKKKLDDMYDGPHEELEDAKNALWQEIADELQIPLQDMSINMNNGDISVRAEQFKQSDDTPVQ